VIRLEGVRKSYDGGRTFSTNDVSFAVGQGELLALIGPSGCGKTTTLKLINRLIEPTAGTILVGGKDVLTQDPVILRRHIGYVFQRIGLLPHFTVAQNVALVPQLLGWPRPEIAARTDELLTLVGLSPEAYRDRMPQALSGGQQQRVGLARALAGRPEIVLKDEPFGALDPVTRDEIGRAFRALHDTLGLTTVMVTHDMTEALLMADRIAVMVAGRIVQLGPPRELVQAPIDDEVRALLEMPRRRADRLEALLRDPSRP
jgi:osmoprotectant transport system ATP-binding protein